ncbi:uncharacterized protein TNCT_440241 [Trichonephila clavata]|uniref:Uncharacterized protein n=1 Tax=Trichonephila clavata TaxID=2740835 RepID=A0A8X6LWW2_TRICU|nr:uncharacterized protein TNCT_440241 [Trichonephila clavata]
MSILNNLRKIDLKLIAEEQGETIPDNAKIFESKKLIKNSDAFQTDQEFVRGIVKSIVEDRTTKAANEQARLELEKIKLAQLEGYRLGTTKKIFPDCDVFQKAESTSLGQYKVVKTKPNDRYNVVKVGSHEGPAATSTSADHMKPWTEDVAA